MSSLMWIIFIAILVMLVLSLLWLIWKLRHFSQSQNQTYLDDKLMQAMLKDQVFSKKLKKELVNKNRGVDNENENDDELDQQGKKSSAAA